MKHRNQVLKYVATGATVLAATAAHAALPAEATAAFTDISGAVADILTAIWPIVAAVTSGFVLISLFKKGASKVS